MMGRMKFGLCLWLLTVVCLSAAEPTNTPSPAKTNAASVAPPARPDALKGFLIKRGFRLDQVASEPLVMDAVAMAFDENGRLFVLESPTSPEAGGNRLGRVRLLEDTDGDGIFDKSSVYASDVPDPTALVCYDGGVFVGAGDQILYLRNSRSGGAADTRREVLRGFGEGTNGVGGRIIITSMVWGLDNRIHVGTAGRGGDIFSSNAPKRSAILTEGNFAFDPRTLEITPESGTAASGMSFDSRGRKYVSTPDEHILQVMYETRYAAHNPLYKMPPTQLDIAPAAPIYPAHTTPGSSAQFTAATGLMIYRGNAFPVDYWENAFVIDTAGGLMHRDKLRTAGIEVFAERSPDEAGFEFCSTKDSRFQPAQLANAPDGALYIVGSDRQKTNPTNSGLAGRIFRIAPLNFKPPAPVQLSNATTAQLVALLRQANGWQRDTASRLIYERQDKAAISPLFQLAFDNQVSPISRLHALYGLAGMQALTAAHLGRLLADPDERIKEHTVLLSEKFIGPSGNLPEVIAGPLLALAGDVSPRVRLQVAFTLGQLKHPARNQALADCLRRDPDNKWIQAAVMSSAGEAAGSLFSALAADGNVRGNNGTRELLGLLVGMISAKGQPLEATTAINAIANIPEPDLAFYLALSLSDGLQRLNSSLVSVDAQGVLPSLYGRAIQVAGDPGASENTQMLAVRLLQTSRFADVQLAASLVNRWRTLSRLMRMDAVVSMLSRTERAAVLLTGLEGGVVPFGDLTSVQIRYLLSHRDPIIRQRALALFRALALQTRQPVVAQYGNAWQLGGAAERGHNLYEARCALCHRFGDDGNPLGKDLADASRLSRAQLLIKILDPNRQLPRNSAQTLIETRDGATLMGFITEQNEKSITLCQPNGEGRVIGRQNIASFDTLGISAMPEGLEAGLNAQDLADLVEYLKPAAAASR